MALHRMCTSKILKVSVLTVLATSVFSGCMSTTAVGYGAERKQLLVTSQDRAIKKADKHNKKSIQASERPYHDVYEQRLVRIINRLSPYADLYTAEGRVVEWDLILLGGKNSQKSQAGALANGTITMTRKMVKNSTFKSDEALAYVLAHEMAHVVRQHHRETETWGFVVKPMLFSTALLTSGATSLIAAAAHDTKRFSKVMEKEADLLGLEIMAQAGFNPEKAMNIFNDMQSTLKTEFPISSRLPSILKAHPSMEKRTEYSSDYLTHVMPLYEQSLGTERLVARNPIRPNLDSTKTVYLYNPAVESILNVSLAEADISENEIAALNLP